MKNFPVIATLVFATTICIAAPITEDDTGTYVVINKNGNPTDLFYRLTLSGQTWKMEGKDTGGFWKDISCEQSCAYTPSTAQDAISFLPNAMRGNYDISCIQNVAQAFCRYTLKTNAKQGGYVVVAFVTGQPTPIIVRRIANE